MGGGKRFIEFDGKNMNHFGGKMKIHRAVLWSGLMFACRWGMKGYFSKS